MRKHLLNYGLAVGALVAAGALGPSAANADLVFQGFIDQGGTGHGAVPTILTMQSHGNGTSESGMVSWGLTSPQGEPPVFGNIVTGDPQGTSPGGLPMSYTPVGTTDMVSINNTILVSDTGWTSGNGLGIVFNPVEPNSPAKQSITLNNLEMTIYDATGKVVFDAPWLDGPLTLDTNNNPGTGNSGYLFSLNQAETNELNTSGVIGDDHIGLLAYATNADGGPETFYGTVIVPDSTPVPAPSNTLGLVGIGLIGTVGAIRWNRRRQQLTFAA